MPGQLSELSPTDTEAIRRLLGAYTLCGDRGDADGLAETFADDGVFEFGSLSLTGRCAIAGWARSARPYGDGVAGPAATFVRHHLTTMQITGTGANTARARTYFFTLTDIGLDHSGQYSDDLVRSSSGWKISRRRVALLWKAGNSLASSPVTQKAT